MPGDPRKGKPAKHLSEGSVKSASSSPAPQSNAKTRQEAEALILGAEILSQVKDVFFAFDHELNLIY